MGFKARAVDTSKPEYPAKLTEFFASASEHARKNLLELHRYCRFSHTNFSDDAEVFGLAEGKNMFELLAENGYVRAEEATEWRARYVPILLDDGIDDWGLPFNALVVDREDANLPVFLLGFHTDGKLRNITMSLKSFVSTFLLGAKSPDPKKELVAAASRASTLLSQEKYDELLALARATVQQFEYLGDIDDGQDNHLRRVLGGMCNFQGLAERNLGMPSAVASFERAYKLGDQHSRLNLIEAYCYDTGEYEKAQKLSRFPTYDDEIWFFKVKVDAYASIMLGDMEQGEKCYRLLHKKYFRKDPQYIETVRRELADTGDAGQAILLWFGVGPTYSSEQKGAQRTWWNELEPNWQRQFRVLLTNKKGADNREKAALATDELTDDQLAAVFEAEAFVLHSEYPVRSLAPLVGLKALRQVRAAYCQEIKCLGEVGQLTWLTTLSLAGNKLDDVSFISGLEDLERLDLGGNNIADISMLGALTKMARLDLAQSTLGPASLSALAGMTGLRKLSLRVDDSVSDISSLASLEALEDLTIRGHGITSLASLSNCRNLVDLDVTSAALTNIEVLGDIDTLRDINLGNCELVDDVSVLSRVSKLRDVDLAFTAVTNLGPLAACKDLRRVQAYLDHKEPVQGLRELVKLPALTKLALSRQSLPYALQKELKAQRPGVLDVS